MKNRIRVIVLLALCVCLSSVVFAETVVLKSGKIIEGKLLEETDKYIKIDFEGVTLTYFLDEIASIEKEKKLDAPILENVIDKEQAQAEEDNLPPVALKEGSAGIQQINEAYYNMARLGFQELECDLTINAFESLKDMLKLKYPATDPKSQILDSVKFHMTFDKEGKVSINYTPFASTGDEIIDGTIKGNIIEMQASLEWFMNNWGSFVGDPYQLPPDQVYAIEKLPSGYVLTYEDTASGSRGKVSIDNKFQIFEDVFEGKGRVHKTKTHYISSKQGLLLQSFEDDLNNELLIATINYQEIDGFQVPKQVSIKNNSIKKPGILEVKFSEYKIKRIP